MKTSSFRAWTAVFMLVSGVALSAAGFFTPPVGQISESVLWPCDNVASLLSLGRVDASIALLSLNRSLCPVYAGSALGIDVIIDHKIKSQSGSPKK